MTCPKPSFTAQGLSAAESASSTLCPARTSAQRGGEALQDAHVVCRALLPQQPQLPLLRGTFRPHLLLQRPDVHRSLLLPLPRHNKKRLSFKVRHGRRELRAADHFQ